jgi:hypothetical protein
MVVLSVALTFAQYPVYVNPQQVCVYLSSKLCFQLVSALNLVNYQGTVL